MKLTCDEMDNGCDAQIESDFKTRICKVYAELAKKAILADCFEAFIGALYLDQGIDKTKEFVQNTVIRSINKNEELFNDYKSKLQELVQTSKKSLEYVVIRETGPSHDKEFEVNVIVENIIYGTGIGKTKKEAEQNAAKDALSKKA